MKNAEIFFGMTVAEAARKSDVPSTTVWRHAKKKRKISPEYAVLYNKTLGIPLHKMRPDLWPDPASTDKPQGDGE